MYRILEARNLAGNIYEMVVEAPRVAKRALPGQFVIVKLNEEAERIPLTICDYDREKGTITIVFQPVGASTSKYVPLKAGDSLVWKTTRSNRKRNDCNKETSERNFPLAYFVSILNQNNLSKR